MQNLFSYFSSFIVTSICLCLFIPFKSYSIEITKIQFRNNPDPYTIQCGDSTLVLIEVDFKIDASDMDHLPITTSLQIYDAVSPPVFGLFNEPLESRWAVTHAQIINSSILSIDSVDAAAGFKICLIYLHCDRNHSGECLLYGNSGISPHGNPHRIFGWPSTFISPNNISSFFVIDFWLNSIDFAYVFCSNPTNSQAYVEPQLPMQRCVSDSANVYLQSPTVPLSGVQLHLDYDSNYFRPFFAHFDSATLSLPGSGYWDTSQHGVLKFNYYFTSPTIIDTPGISFATVHFSVNCTTPYADYPARIDTSSRLLDPSHNPVAFSPGSTFFEVLPVDTTAPFINCSAITVTDSSISGGLESIGDNFFDTLSEYVVINLLQKDSVWGWLGEDTLHADGSFLIDGVTIVPRDSLLLFVTDMLGNVATCNLISPNAVKNIQASNNGVIIYPNPTGDIMNITLNRFGNDYVTIEVFDLLGRMVIEKNIKKSALTSLDVGMLSDGCYFMKLHNADSCVTEKFVVRRNK